MRVEVHSDELLVVIDAGELPPQATARSLAAKLPGSAPDIASEVVTMLDAPKPASGPVTVRSVTVKVVRTQIVAEETLLLAEAKQVFA